MLEIPWLDHFQFVIWPPYSSTPWSFQDWFDPQRSIVYRYNMGTSVNIFQRVRWTLLYVFSDSMSSSILCAFTSWPSRQVHLSKLAWVWVTQWLQWSRLPVRQVLNHGILERFWNYSWRKASHLTKQATTRGQFEWPSKPGMLKFGASVPYEFGSPHAGLDVRQVVTWKPLRQMSKHCQMPSGWSRDTHTSFDQTVCLARVSYSFPVPATFWERKRQKLMSIMGSSPVHDKIWQVRSVYSVLHML